MATTHTNLLTHIIFSTKHREPLIAPAWQDDLFAFIGGVVRNRRSILLAVGGMPDHIHLLAKTPADLAVSDFVRDVKANSSKWRRDGGDAGFGWQTGYGAFSVSGSMADTVVGYIARQPEHHRAKTFQTEFVEFLDRHGVEYDPQYLWE